MIFTKENASRYLLWILLVMIIGYAQVMDAKEDIVRDIILINGVAELADFNQEGEILLRHISIPDYFTSGRSHSRSLRESLAKINYFGASEVKDRHDERVHYAPVACRQSLMQAKKPEVVDKSNMSPKDMVQQGSDDASFVYHLSSRRGIDPLILERTTRYSHKHEEIKFNPSFRQRTLTLDRYLPIEHQLDTKERTSKVIIDV